MFCFALGLMNSVAAACSSPRGWHFGGLWTFHIHGKHALRPQSGALPEECPEVGPRLLLPLSWIPGEEESRGGPTP